MFGVGIISCLKFLEVVPRSKDEEEKVVFHLGQLQLYDSVAEVLQRVPAETSTSTRPDDIYLRLLTAATCMDKSRRDQGVIMSEIARKADNMQCIVNILIDKNKLVKIL
ncbi:hypothetical protein PVL29_010229 [Vitis rotundifolia]|uniref:Uncharacterized protein n=1 Tax=Vitis rotundifolia TaxID=103349 RepID=A0AA39DRS8_VITRO|nr:hypothetical protein PVL29_010229 [Vitis rotundifolia]